MLIKFCADLTQIHCFSQLHFKRSNSFIRNSARHDILKILQICLDIKRKTVHRHPTAEVYAYGTNFPIRLAFSHTPDSPSRRSPLTSYSAKVRITASSI